MDDRINVTKRKPRRLRGTPALKFANRLSLIVLAVGTSIGVLINYNIPILEDIKKKFNIDLIHVSQAELDKRAAFRTSLVGKKSGEEILKHLEEQKKQESQR